MNYYIFTFFFGDEECQVYYKQREETPDVKVRWAFEEEREYWRGQWSDWAMTGMDDFGNPAWNSLEEEYAFNNVCDGEITELDEDEANALGEVDWIVI